MSKIILNFDLTESIQRANHGISIKHTIKNISLYTGINSLINLSLIKSTNFPIAISSATLAYFVTFLPAIPILKIHSLKTISTVVNELHKLDVHTNTESLLKAKIYKNEYKFKFNQKRIPDILQNKYILIPTSEETEVSLLQEHIIGDNKYYLSVGEPEKVYKLAFNGA